MKRQPPRDRHKLIVNRQKCPRCASEVRAAATLRGYSVCTRCGFIVMNATLADVELREARP